MAHVLTDDNEDLANLVTAGGARASLGFVVGNDQMPVEQIIPHPQLIESQDCKLEVSTWSEADAVGAQARVTCPIAPPDMRSPKRKRLVVVGFYH